MLNRLRHDERGFTLPELLITLIIALTVSLATFSLIDFVMKRTGEIASRVETVQRARTAMDQVTRLLRSQVCAWRGDDALMTGSRSLYSASPTAVTPFTDFSSETLVSGVLPAPALRTLTLSNPVNGTLTETTIPGKWVGGKVSYTYAGVTTTTRQVLTNVSLYTPVGSTADPTPLFRYFTFNAADPPQPINEVGVGRALTADELESVAKITVTFRVLTAAGDAKGSTVLTGDVYVRTADPNAEDPQPKCATT
ncbi:prepilin-type N-terminal cleavage/methylation domain-containing protein [Solirubrobacter ginsenosidimutans]|uniref:Prepilin-type N-terminal cleavage/methylation domain-containing protein n=1 Tax=Solirubrobacter ginsenosidimutans TaxID=490573 RepID=A0A9X3N4D5_9ACTN|nr:prepilin-type N-terminal cleavage/methylation domain-containing protein [Solirubrobacter ginsenosidimutans]MDA0166447.1 prepilin-type N-terminal cleavage/methylation domain-containing protein [Solirubrobacter ginsenosidimutans]